MPKYTDQQIKNILLNCAAAPMHQLLTLCLDLESGITVESLRAAKYPKIDQLEAQVNAQLEDIIWAQSQNDIDKLQNFINKIEQGRFSTKHLSAAKARLRDLAAAMEDKDWESVSTSSDLNVVNGFINKCKQGTYSNAHLNEALSRAERLEWESIQTSGDAQALNAFIQRCLNGEYSQTYLESAKQELDKVANGTIVAEWNKILSVNNDTQIRIQLLNEFLQRYIVNPTDIAREYVEKAKKMLDKIADEEEARVDWYTAKDENTILSYSDFISKHPHSDYREEAETRIANMKGNLLNEMSCCPFRFRREDMAAFINSGVLTMEDLVDNSNILTDRAYSHIKRYPQLVMEQRALPVSKLENPTSEPGNTDVYFFGVGGSGKTCVLAGLMSLTGQLGFKFDPTGPGGGGHYAMDLRTYARTSMLPPATDQSYIQVIDAEINDENGNLQKIAFIEMSGEKTAQFAAMSAHESFDDLGPGAAGLMNNDNNKVIFFVIDPTNEKWVNMGYTADSVTVNQSDMLSCVTSLLAKYTSFMKKVVAIHVILTKSDTLGDYVDQAVIMDKLTEQGYQVVLNDIKMLCQKFDINKATGFHAGLFPFCIGRFMPGEVYTFDETDSLKVLRVIQKNVMPIRPVTVWDRLGDWFNS